MVLFKNIFVFLLLVSNMNLFAQSHSKITTRTTDLTRTLSIREREKLDDDLYAIEQNTGRQVVILMVSTTGSQSIEDYATQVFRETGIGDKERNDGVLILVAKDDRMMRIEVGYGLEGTISDLLADGIINQKMKPRFQENDFYEGLHDAVQSINGLISGSLSEKQLEVLRNKDAAPKGISKLGKLFFVLFFICLGIGVLIGKRKIETPVGLTVVLVVVVASAAIAGNGGALIMFGMFSILPVLFGYAMALSRKARIFGAVLGAIVLLFVFIGLILGEQAVIQIIVAIFLVCFFGVVIYTVISDAKDGFSGSTSGSSRGWTSSGSSSHSSGRSSSSSSSSSSRSSFSGGGGSSGGGGASGSW